MTVTIEGSSEEIAALMIAAQGRQFGDGFIPIDVMMKAVREAIGGTAEASQNSSPPLSDT